MNRFFFFIREGFRALRRSAAPSIAALITIVVTVILLGVLIPIFQSTNAKSQEIRNQLELKVFMFNDATQTEIHQLQTQIEGIGHVRSVDYVSPAAGLAQLKSTLSDPSITNQLSENPLPPAFTVKVDNADNLETVSGSLQPPNASGKATPISPIIQKVEDSRTDANKIRSVTSALKIILIVITALLLVASLGLIGNTIRLSIFSRRREVEVMRLVGATNWFIRWPFVVEGLVVGFLGGLIAIAILFAGKLTVLDPLSSRFHFVQAQNSISFLPLALVLLGAAMAVSALGSGLTLRRFMRV